MIWFKRFVSQADYERKIVSDYFDIEEDEIPVHMSSWTLYCIKNGDLIHSIRQLNLSFRNAVIEGYHVKGKTMFKEKLNVRLRKLGPFHDFVKHATRIHDEEWVLPEYVTKTENGVDRSRYTIVLHPWLVNYIRVYKLDARDVVEGMLFGDADRYERAAQHQLWNHPSVPRKREINDYVPIRYAE